MSASASGLAQYEQIKVIGRGSFGRALLVRRRSDSQRLVIKQLPLHELNPGDQAGAHQEVQVLSMLSHPYIVGFHDSFVENDLLNIVIDYADGGDLHDLIKRAQRRPEPDNLLPEPFVLDVFAQIALAIEYIHERHILHRDLKTQNVFLTKDGHVMIGDFGISKILTADTDFARTVIGTPYYLSPELCEDKKYNHKSDIWALGCILYELATLRHAFDGNNLPALILKIIRGIYPPVDDRYSDDLKSLIASMLRENPDHRPELHEILELPFLQAIVQKHRAIIAAHVASRNGAGVKHKMALLEQRALDIAADQAVADMLPVSPTHRVAALVDSDHTDSEQTLSERAYFPAPPALLVEQPVGGPSGANRSLNSWMSEIENQIQNVQLDLRGGGDVDGPLLSPSRLARPSSNPPHGESPAVAPSRPIPSPVPIAPSSAARRDKVGNITPTVAARPAGAIALSDMFADAVRQQHPHHAAPAPLQRPSVAAPGARSRQADASPSVIAPRGKASPALPVLNQMVNSPVVASAAANADTPLTMKQRQAQYKREREEQRQAEIAASKERERQFKSAVKNVASSGLRGDSSAQKPKASNDDNGKRVADVSQPVFQTPPQQVARPKVAKTEPPKPSRPDSEDSSAVTKSAARPSLAEIKQQYRLAVAQGKAPAPTDNIDIVVAKRVPLASEPESSPPPIEDDQLPVMIFAGKTNRRAELSCSPSPDSISQSAGKSVPYFFVPLDGDSGSQRCSPLQSLPERIEATRAQCEECFGATTFEKVYRTLRDASDAQDRVLDDLHCFLILKQAGETLPKSLLPFVRYVKQLIALENEHFGT